MRRRGTRRWDDPRWSLSGEQMLLRAGWTPDRRVDTTRAVAALETHGFRLTAGHLAFLSRYDGLGIEYRKPGKDRFPDNALRLDAVEAGSGGWVPEFDERAGVPLVPVGFASDRLLLVLRGEDGTFWAAFDLDLYRMGATVERLLELLAGPGDEGVLEASRP